MGERFIRTLKQSLLQVRAFATVEELRKTLIDFRRTYKDCCQVNPLAYRHTAQARRDFLARQEQAA